MSVPFSVTRSRDICFKIDTQRFLKDPPFVPSELSIFLWRINLHVFLRLKIYYKNVWEIINSQFLLVTNICNITSIDQGCARLPEMLQNFSERHILLENELGSCLCFNIEIAYSNFNFYGAYKIWHVPHNFRKTSIPQKFNGLFINTDNLKSVHNNHNSRVFPILY